MLTRIMKWGAIGMLLLAGLRLPVGTDRVLLEFVVCASSLLVAAQAFRAGRYVWAIVFAAIALVFNPIIPVAVDGAISVWLAWICFAAFLVSLVALRRPPITAIRPGTDRSVAAL
jgi:hypothetical protein